MPTLGDDPALDAETRVPILVGTSVAFTVASSLVVLLRIYTRFVIVHSLGIDDYTMVAAAVLAVGVTVVTILQAQNGLGHHVWIPISAEETQIQLKALFAGEVLYNLSQILIKISVLMQYRRIFLDELTRLICFWLILFLTLWGITQEFLVAFACIPVPLFIASMADKCISSSTVWYLTSIMNIITDFVIFLVPIPAIRNLALQLRQKLLVMSLFCLGFLYVSPSLTLSFSCEVRTNRQHLYHLDCPPLHAAGRPPVGRRAVGQRANIVVDRYRAQLRHPVRVHCHAATTRAPVCTWLVGSHVSRESGRASRQRHAPVKQRQGPIPSQQQALQEN